MLKRELEYNAMNNSKGMISRTVVITGASRGIGEACALYLDKKGFRVFAGVRREEDAADLRAKASSSLVPVKLDITSEDSIRSAADVIGRNIDGHGLDGLVNNAGIALAGPLEFLPLERYREQFEVNVFGQIAVTQKLLPLLRPRRGRGGGRIVFIGSMEGLLAMPFLSPYCASKFAVEAVAASLRMELRIWDIHVSVVEPGVIDTSLLDRALCSAEECINSMPREAHELYGPFFTRGRQIAGKLSTVAIPATPVVKSVEYALTARRPALRYTVGTTARLMEIMARFVPGRLRDWLLLRQMGFAAVR
ncbi:MAG: SDR family oxidoreductase [Dehalococcoidales bacterium]|nr:SDR family oxidoreductase [Dehalococcoidales bacterium]